MMAAFTWRLDFLGGPLESGARRGFFFLTIPVPLLFCKYLGECTYHCLKRRMMGSRGGLQSMGLPGDSPICWIHPSSNSATPYLLEFYFAY